MARAAKARTGFAIGLSAALGWLVGLTPVPMMIFGAGVSTVGASIIAGVYSAVVLGVIIAPLRAMLTVRSPMSVGIDLVILTAAIMAAGWAMTHLAHGGKRWRLRASSAAWAVTAFVAAGGLSGASATSPTLWLGEFIKWLMVLGLVAIVGLLGRWLWLAYGLALAGAANAVLGIYVYFGGSGVSHFAINERNFRAFGTFEQPNPFGGFMGVLTPFLAALAFGGIIRLWHVWRYEARFSPLAFTQTAFFGVCAALTAAALIFSWSRGAWLALGAALLVMVVTLPRRLRYSVTILALVVSLGGLLWASGRLPTSITERVTSSFADLLSADDVRGVDVTPENYAAIERFAHWQAAIEMSRYSPWIGVGLGNYEAVYPRVRLIAWEYPLGHAHNYYLNVLAETGIIGLCTYLAMWITIVIITWRARRHPSPLSSAAAAGLLGTWTYIAVHSLTDQLYVNSVFLHVGVLIGIAALLAHQTTHSTRLSL